jgi:hypothetical protein
MLESMSHAAALHVHAYAAAAAALGTGAQQATVQQPTPAKITSRVVHKLITTKPRVISLTSTDHQPEQALSAVPLKAQPLHEPIQPHSAAAAHSSSQLLSQVTAHAVQHTACASTPCDGLHAVG